MLNLKVLKGLFPLRIYTSASFQSDDVTGRQGIVLTRRCIRHMPDTEKYQTP